jgi:hypothetical protein
MAKVHKLGTALVVVDRVLCATASEDLEISGVLLKAMTEP